MTSRFSYGMKHYRGIFLQVIKFGNPNRDYQSKARRRVVCRSQSSAVRALILAPRRLDQPITTRVMIALWLAFKLGRVARS